MFRRIDRYISKELIVPLFAGTIVIAILFAANELIAIFKNLNVSVLPAASIAQLVLLRMPRWLILTLPVGMAIGASLAIGRLARESEVTAMRAAGIPLRRLLAPVAAWGLLLSVLNFWIADFVHPASSERYRKLANEVFLISAQPTFRSDMTLKLGRYTVQLGAVDRQSDGSLKLRDVFLFEVLSPDEMWIYTAPNGTYRDGIWSFPKATVRLQRKLSTVHIGARDAVIKEPIRVQDLMGAPAPDELTTRDLGASIGQKRSLGDSPVKLQIELYSRYAVPASCFIFAVTSALAALRAARSGPFTGMMVSLILVAVYFNAYIIATQIVGPNGWLPPDWAAWLPNILYVVLAAALYWRSE